MIGLYSYTVILTYLSLAISVFGMVQTLDGNYPVALLCLMASGICDMFDGKVARTKKNRTEDEKRFGIQIDSLCDLVCFGVFPAMIGYSLGVRSIFGKTYLALFVLAAVIRLGYFNVTEEQRQQQTEEKRVYYQGLPVTSVAVIIPLVFLTRHYFTSKFPMFYEAVLMVVALLFILDIKVKKPDLKMTVILGVVALFIIVRLVLLCFGIGGV